MIARICSIAFYVTALLVAGCTAVPDPTTTPANPAADLATVERIRPSATPTISTPSPTPIAVETHPQKDSNATVRPSPTPSPEPTVPTLFVPGWATNVTEVNIIHSGHIYWSPTTNQFIIGECLSDNHTATRLVYVATFPLFQPIDVTPADLVCGFKMDVLWHPDGHYFLLSATPNREDFIIQDINATWKISQDGQVVHEIELTGHYPNLVGWMDDTLFVQEHYSAGGHWHITITDIETGITIARGKVHASMVEDLTPAFVITNNGMQAAGPYSAAAMSTETVNPENQELLAGPYLQYLSEDYPFEHYFNSRYEDTLPGTNQVLALTWEAGTYLTSTGEIHTDLQLWNLESNELTLLVPGAFNGRFSPDGQFLAYMTSSDVFQVHLLNQASGQIVMTSTADSQHLSFSPDGRFLTFYAPTPELMVYDLEAGEFLPPLTAVPFTPLWSPDSSRFVYQHPTRGLSIFALDGQTAYPLAASGGERLSNPQWSYDGAYLSVNVRQEDGGRATAVLKLP